MTWKSFLSDYFKFSRAERFGITVICVCLLLAQTVKWYMPYWVKPVVFDSTAYAEEIAQFRIAVNSTTTANESAEQQIYAQTETEYFYFDPNSAADNEWVKLGFNERQIRNIRNYQASGGKFRRKEDLQKLYTISAIQYQRVEPYIRISENNRTAVKPSKTWDASSRNIAKQDENNVAGSQRIAKPKIEINTADSSLLTQLPGIGPVFASRTVKYRNAIGGFINVTQLSEVYGINADLVERLTPLVSVDSSLIRKISLNTANLNTLIKHPYINEQQARGIIEYRKRQNRINNLNELIKNNIIERETAEKIKPYLSLE